MKRFNTTGKCIASQHYSEAQTRDLSSTDVVIDYHHLKTGYLVSFCFSKNKQTGVKDITVGDKTICEAVI